MGQDLEEGNKLGLDFGKIKDVASKVDGVIPAVAQDIETGLVLIVGYVNELALQTAMTDKMAVFWSTSRNQLWIKCRKRGDNLWNSWRRFGRGFL